MARKKRLHHPTPTTTNKKKLSFTLSSKPAPEGHNPRRATIVMRDKRNRREQTKLRKTLRDY